MIYKDFCALVAAYVSNEGLRVSWPGINFQPPKNGPWIEVSWNQNGSDERVMDDTDSAVDLGFFRVLVNDRPGVSIMKAASVATDLQAHIPKGTRIGNATINRQPEITGPVTDEQNRIILHTVTFRYQTV